MTFFRSLSTRYNKYLLSCAEECHSHGRKNKWQTDICLNQENPKIINPLRGILVFIKQERSQTCLQDTPRHWRNFHFSTENLTLIIHTVTEQHGKQRVVVLPHSTAAHSHQLKRGRALNNSKHTSQLESAERTYQGKKKVSIDVNQKRVYQSSA